MPARPADPEVDKALREVEAELATRWGETKLEPSVGRIAALMDVLGDPQRSYPSIHITGTNGKTSTARMIEALLGAFELRTGRYTSPHVQSITERISLDGAPISAERFIETYQDIKPYVEMVDAHAGVPAVLLRGAHRHGVRGLRRRAGGRRRRRGGHGRHLGRHQRDRRRRRRGHAHRPGPHRPARARRPARSPPRRPGSSSRTPPSMLAQQPVDAAAGAAAAGRRGGRHRGPRGHGVRRRRPRRSPSAASWSPCAGLGGEYERGVPAAARRPPGAQRGRRARRRRGVLRRRRQRPEPLDLDTVRKALRRRHLAGPAGGRPPLPDRRAGRRAQPGRRAGHRRGASARRSTSPG